MAEKFSQFPWGDDYPQKSRDFLPPFKIECISLNFIPGDPQPRRGYYRNMSDFPPLHYCFFNFFFLFCHGPKYKRKDLTLIIQQALKKAPCTRSKLHDKPIKLKMQIFSTKFFNFCLKN